MELKFNKLVPVILDIFKKFVDSAYIIEIMHGLNLHVYIHYHICVYIYQKYYL